ncbi:hypothetical protein LTR16_002625 [Cryomyces antarcticus]|uniref:Peptidase S33 tripeptidyl aminopeptidase-like C-terminal domain-containing protein n=1 Tax=Cryomyces antarcticus TaxID=329879 RepID=A0ABR0LPJ5_9PEZI|nr:hypothetical protein LTR16_002625 [Cryomyces antarcticus]
MDYWNGSTSRKIGLAVARLPAKVPVTDQRYAGALMINPGGPGGSGIDIVRRAGSVLQNILDTFDDPSDRPANDSNARYYDILSFDPRGAPWMLRVLAEGNIGSSDAAQGRLWSMSHALGATCSAKPDAHDDIKRHVSTASVARDMLELMEKHGQWREAEASKSCRQSTNSGRGSRISNVQGRKVRESLQYKPGQEKLQYWGFSYGTYLGSTFASMFPDRIERMILDGVVNAPNYLQALWSDNLIDTEKVLRSFYHHCASAGPSACALARKDSTAAEIEKRVHDILLGIFHNPLPVNGTIPEVITYSDTKNLIFSGLYTPLRSFPVVAELLAGLERGDGTEFAKLLAQSHQFHCSDSPDRSGRIHSTSTVNYAGLAVACGDGDAQGFLTYSLFDKHRLELESMSPHFGAIWSALRLQCAGWQTRPLHRFRGPFTAHTSHPILWIGNTADPVTTLHSAHEMARHFPDSVVLTQDSPGHCSIAAFSLCTVGRVRTYLHFGELPEKGTVCKADQRPFGDGGAHADGVAMGMEGREVWMADEEVRMLASGHAKLAEAVWGEGAGFVRQIVGGRVRI